MTKPLIQNSGFHRSSALADISIVASRLIVGMFSFPFLISSDLGVSLADPGVIGYYIAR